LIGRMSCAIFFMIMKLSTVGTAIRARQCIRQHAE
jgi:hypothetical protein